MAVSFLSNSTRHFTINANKNGQRYNLELLNFSLCELLHTRGHSIIFTIKFIMKTNYRASYFSSLAHRFLWPSTNYTLWVQLWNINILFLHVFIPHSSYYPPREHFSYLMNWNGLRRPDSRKIEYQTWCLFAIIFTPHYKIKCIHLLPNKVNQKVLKALYEMEHQQLRTQTSINDVPNTKGTKKIQFTRERALWHVRAVARWDRGLPVIPN